MEPTEWIEAQDTVSVTVDEHVLNIAYYRAGSGPVVIFLHGIPTWSFLWRDIVQGITDEYDVVVPDMVGYGKSSKYDGFDRSIRAQEAVLDALIDTMDFEVLTIVGHDIGGGVALRYAVHNPDSVEKLVLSNATAYDSWPIESILCLGLPTNIDTTGVEELREILAEAYEETLAGKTGHEEFIEGMLAQVQNQQDATSMGRNAIALNTNHTTELEYGAITAETLLLWGEDDNEQPITDAERLQDDLQQATLVGLDEPNHWVTEDRPKAYRNELRMFLG